jgi:double zinc ribbon protein
VTCVQCRHENRPAAKFCENCGAALPPVCGGCGTTLRPGARFCDACGQAVGMVVAAGPAAPPAPAGYTPKHLADKILTSRSAI